MENKNFLKIIINIIIRRPNDRIIGMDINEAELFSNGELIDSLIGSLILFTISVGIIFFIELATLFAEFLIFVPKLLAMFFILLIGAGINDEFEFNGPEFSDLVFVFILLDKSIDCYNDN